MFADIADVRQRKRLLEVKKEEEAPNKGPNVDYSLKEGEKISINIGNVSCNFIDVLVPLLVG
jgi:hypothetical protein